MKNSFTTLAGLAASGLVLAACEPASTKSEPENVGLANPAAVFCTESGGTYDIRNGADGQYGLCTLPDGREVDAWDYFREENG